MSTTFAAHRARPRARFKRTGEGEDPPEWLIDDPERRSEVASAAYTLIDRIKLTPGTDADGTINVEALKSWLSEVRSACQRHGRGAIADQMIGQLLSRAPAGEDGIWPSRPVCEALEGMGSQEVAKGFRVGAYNSRGAHWRDEGGNQERELAARYRGFAKRLAFEYPYVASVLESIASSYDREASWNDADAKVSSRLPY